MNPEAFPCDICNCVDGDAGMERWTIPGEALFTDVDGNPSDSTRKCPTRMISDDSQYLLGLYRYYRTGHLFVEGGLSSQPHLYLEAMKIIDMAIDKANTHARKSAR